MPEHPDGPGADPVEVDSLIERYVNGTLTAEEADRLLQRLRAQPELGGDLLDQLAVDSMLRDLGRADRPHLRVPTAGDRIRRSGRPRVVARAAAIAAGLLIAGTVAFGLRPGPGPTPTARTSGPAPAEATTTAVAVLTRAVDASWGGPSQDLRVGTLLAPGWLKLEAGLARVEFFSGARVVLEGPAELRLVSTNEAFCRAGRLTADVPTQARGFRIGTPQRDVVDRGTAFGVEVKPTVAVVHVFRGKVELHDGGTGREDVDEGQGVTLEAGGAGRRLASSAAGFVTGADLDRRFDEALRRRRDAWRAAQRGRNSDPALVARFDFETADGADRVLRNVAEHASPAGDGSVVGCGWSDGRWPGKGALEFRGVGDRVRLDLPGEYASLSLAAWVRVNGLDRKFNSLLMADAFDAGAVHWQVLSDGRVRLGVAGPGRTPHADYDSPPVFTPERFGQWVHLALVYDARARLVTHYRDGRPLNRRPLEFDVGLRLDPAELGNWNPGTRSDATPIRHFSGRIDELAVYSRALTDAEVERLHADGSDSADGRQRDPDPDPDSTPSR